MAWMRRGFALLILAGLLAGSFHPATAQQQTSREFPETGHIVTGEFLAFYQSVPDPLLVFGYPITDVFVDPIRNLQVQYFQRARFELHVDAPASQRVQLGTVGTLVYQKAQVQPVESFPTNTPVCQSFTSPEGHYFVCYAFLAFFKAHGGLAQFGYPISDYVREGDQRVQYFERARFEWIPELNSDQWVKLADIGTIQFDQSGQDQNLKNPNTSGFIGQRQIIQLQAHAFVSKAVVNANSTQTIFVVVQDQNLQPVSGALSLAKIKLPTGEEQSIILPPTNSDGFSQLQFNVGDLAANQVIQVSVDVSLGSYEATTSAWYRIWW